MLRRDDWRGQSRYQFPAVDQITRRFKTTDRSIGEKCPVQDGLCDCKRTNSRSASIAGAQDHYSAGKCPAQENLLLTTHGVLKNAFILETSRDSLNPPVQQHVTTPPPPCQNLVTEGKNEFVQMNCFPSVINVFLLSSLQMTMFHSFLVQSFYNFVNSTRTLRFYE